LSTEADQYLAEVYRAESKADLRQAYERWAHRYDRDLVEELGWDKPARAAEVVRRLSHPEWRVLDVGCGTGLVGVALGYPDMTALDYTPAMLAQARAREVYRELVLHDLDEPLPFATGSFEIVVGVGVFTEGHVGSGCLPELARVAREYVVFTLRDDLLEGFPVDLPLVERVRFEDGLGARPWSVWVYRGSSPSGPP